MLQSGDVTFTKNNNKVIAAITRRPIVQQNKSSKRSHQFIFINILSSRKIVRRVVFATTFVLNVLTILADHDFCPIGPPILSETCRDYYRGLRLTCNYGEESCCIEEGGSLRTFPSMACVCDEDQSYWSCLYTDACELPFPYTCKEGNEEGGNEEDATPIVTGCPELPPISLESCFDYYDGVMLKCEYGEESCCDEGGSLRNYPSVICNCDRDQPHWSCYYTEACKDPDSYDCEGGNEEVSWCFLPLVKLLRFSNMRWLETLH